MRGIIGSGGKSVAQGSIFGATVGEGGSGAVGGRVPVGGTSNVDGWH